MTSRRVRRAALAATGITLAGLTTAAPIGAQPLSGAASPPSNALWAAASHGQLLGVSQINAGDMVGFWQGFLASYHMIACPSALDGHYGTGTANATKALQSFFGLTQDGVVGSNTWGAAGGWLTWSAGTGTYDLWSPSATTTANVEYAHLFSTGVWKWRSPATSDYPTWKNSDSPAINFTNGGTCH
jgi:Putative peptidoglycan binding domain